MFGNGRRIDELASRLDELEEHHRKSTSQISAEVERRIDELHRVVGEDPERRLALALNAISVDLAAQRRQALDAVEALRRMVDEMTMLQAKTSAVARGDAGRAARMIGELNRIYRSEWTGYVSLYFDGGTTDIVTLLIGSTSPPTECVCTLNSTNRFNSYAGAVVRGGEYWVARSSHEAGSQASGVRCVFTPFA